MGHSVVECGEVLENNYLPYAISVIVDRALAEIDGLKPGQRKLLYTMYKMGLLKGNNTKCANIVGQTMKLNPHGDMAIYDTLVKLVDSNGTLLAPYIKGKGTFGKVYSDDKYAAARYTEARLTKLAEELFDGIDEDAVEFIDNYDGSMKEPMLLPVKFPNVLVNSTAGIAVGMSSNVAKYNLRDVCRATIGVIDGSVKNIDDLYNILMCPDFTTGGIIHNTGNDFKDILNKKGTLTITSRMNLDKNRLDITEIPYSTTAKKIVDKVIDGVRSGELKQVADAKDLSDLNGLHIAIDFKRGTDTDEAVEELLRFSDLRSTVSFENRILVNGVPRLLSVMDIIKEWIKFRVSTIKRVYKFRMGKCKEKLEKLEALEKIKDIIREVAVMLVDNTENEVADFLKTKYDMSEVQVDYILDMRARDMTKDKVAKKLEELDDTRLNLEYLYEMSTNEEKIKAQIVTELNEIIKKYGRDRHTEIGQPLIKKSKVIKVDDSPVVVSITKEGYIKKTRNEPLEKAFLGAIGTSDEVTHRIECKNNESILIFDYNGCCHKINVKDIDESKGASRDMLVKYIGKGVDILHITASGDYTKEVVFVNADCKGFIIKLERVKNNRPVYKSLYDAGTPDDLWCIEESEFMLITKSMKAVYCDVSKVERTVGNTRITFRVCRKDPTSTVFGPQPVYKIPNIDKPGVKEDIIDKYEKGYFIKIKHALW